MQRLARFEDPGGLNDDSASCNDFPGPEHLPAPGLPGFEIGDYDNAHDLVYRDGYLYVTAQNDNQFGILKINDRRILERAVPSD